MKAVSNILVVYVFFGFVNNGPICPPNLLYWLNIAEFVHNASSIVSLSVSICLARGWDFFEAAPAAAFDCTFLEA